MEGIHLPHDVKTQTFRLLSLQDQSKLVLIPPSPTPHLHQLKISSSTFLQKNIPPKVKSSSLNNNFHVITQQKPHFWLQSLLSCAIFILTLYSLSTQVMLIFILIDIQYLQNVVSSFKKGSNVQNGASLGPTTRQKFPRSKISYPLHCGGNFPPPLMAIRKTLRSSISE